MKHLCAHTEFVQRVLLHRHLSEECFAESVQQSVEFSGRMGCEDTRDKYESAVLGHPPKQK